MGSVGFGANGGSAFTDRRVASPVGIALGKADAAGRHPILITGLALYFGGNGGTRNCYMFIDGNTTGVFGATNGVSLQNAGISAFYANGGTATIGIQPSPDFQSILFGRGGGGSTSDADGTSWVGTIGGVYSYAESPAAPTFTVTPNSDGTQATIVITAAVDTGGSALTGYRFQRATDAGFTAGLATVMSTGTTIVTGLAPGTSYYWRAGSRNAVSDADGSLAGPWASAQLVAQPDPFGLGRYFDGSVFFEADGRYFDGTSFVELDGRRYDSISATWGPLGR